MSGVSRLLGLMAITELQNVQSYLTSELSPSTDTSKLLELSATALRETNNMVSNPTKTYSTFSSKIIKQIQFLHSSLSLIGQLTQLRSSICCHLTSISKFDSKLLHSCLHSFQQSIINRSLKRRPSLKKNYGKFHNWSDLPLFWPKSWKIEID